jgi:hypothetical protein
MRLEGDRRRPRLVVIATGRDLTRGMRAWSVRRARQLLAQGLDGFILKARSPSCGLRRVLLRDREGGSRRIATGLFAAALREAEAILPLAEEGDLEEAARLRAFLVRVRMHWEWRGLLRRRGRGLQAFHRAHAPLIQACSRAGWERLEAIAAGAGSVPNPRALRRYAEELFRILEWAWRRRPEAFT